MSLTLFCKCYESHVLLRLLIISFVRCFYSFSLIFQSQKQDRCSSYHPEILEFSHMHLEAGDLLSWLAKLSIQTASKFERLEVIAIEFSDDVGINLATCRFFSRDNRHYLQKGDTQSDYTRNRGLFRCDLDLQNGRQKRC